MTAPTTQPDPREVLRALTIARASLEADHPELLACYHGDGCAGDWRHERHRKLTEEIWQRKRDSFFSA